MDRKLPGNCRLEFQFRIQEDGKDSNEIKNAKII